MFQRKVSREIDFDVLNFFVYWNIYEYQYRFFGQNHKLMNAVIDVYHLPSYRYI